MNARIALSLSRREFLKASGALIISAGGLLSSAKLLRKPLRASNRRSSRPSSIPGSRSCPTDASPPSSARWTWASRSTSRSRRSSPTSSTSTSPRSTSSWETPRSPATRGSLRQHRHPDGRPPLAQRGGRSAPAAAAIGIAETRASGRAVARRRRRGQRCFRSSEENELRRADRRPPLPPPGRMEQADRQSHGHQGPGKAEVAF